MSMIGKLRQVSLFDLAWCKKDPGEMVRALEAGPVELDPRLYARMRETFGRSATVQQMMEMSAPGKAPNREEQLALQPEMMQLLSRR